MVQSQQKKPLHDVLQEVLNSPYCYFSPLSDLEMTYPCIVYHLESSLDRHADNIKYFSYDRYTVTIIDEDPDSVIYRRLKELPYTRFDRWYVADGLNHFVFTLYYTGQRIKEEQDNGED